MHTQFIHCLSHKNACIRNAYIACLTIMHAYAIYVLIVSPQVTTPRMYSKFDGASMAAPSGAGKNHYEYDSPIDVNANAPADLDPFATGRYVPDHVRVKRPKDDQVSVRVGGVDWIPQVRVSSTSNVCLIATNRKFARLLVGLPKYGSVQHRMFGLPRMGVPCTLAGHA